MSFLEFEILVYSVFVVFGLSVLPPVNRWMRAFFSKLPLFVLLILLLLPLFLPGETKAKFTVHSLDLVRMIRIGDLVAITCLSWVFLAMKRYRLRSSAIVLRCYLIYAIIAMLSASYSVNALLSLWKGFEVFSVVSVLLVISVFLKKLEDIQDLIGGTYLIILFLVVTAMLGFILAPEIALHKHAASSSGGGGELWGVFPLINPNTLTQFSGIIALSGVVASFHTTRTDHGALVLTFVLLILGVSVLLLAHSRTSLIALLSCVVLFKSSKTKGLNYLLVAIAFVITVGVLENIIKFVLRGQSIELFLSMSGRTYIWERGWDAFMSSPLLGYGYYAGHRQLDLTGINSDIVSTVDNTYLEVLIDLGVIGLIPIAIAVWVTIRNMISARGINFSNNMRAVWRQCWVYIAVLLIFVLVRSLTGPSIQVYHPNLIIFLIGGVSLDAARRIFIQQESRESEINTRRNVIMVGNG